MILVRAVHTFTPMEKNEVLGTPVSEKLTLEASGQSLDRLGRREDIRDDSAEILVYCSSFFFYLQEALVNSLGMGIGVQSWMLSIQHFLFRPWRRPPPKETEI